MKTKILAVKQFGQFELVRTTLGSVVILVHAASHPIPGPQQGLDTALIREREFDPIDGGYLSTDAEDLLKLAWVDVPLVGEKPQFGRFFQEFCVDQLRYALLLSSAPNSRGFTISARLQELPDED